jgi:hypothetical protein
MQEMTAVITRFQAATDALAALGARLGMGEGATGCADVHPLARKSPLPIGFVTGQKA